MFYYRDLHRTTVTNITSPYCPLKWKLEVSLAEEAPEEPLLHQQAWHLMPVGCATGFP